MSRPPGGLVLGVPAAGCCQHCEQLRGELDELRDAISRVSEGLMREVERLDEDDTKIRDEMQAADERLEGFVDDLERRLVR